MARRKAPVNETEEQSIERRIKESISNHATRSEKVSWERQFTNLQKLIDNELQPIEQDILSLIVKKNKIFDKMSIIREELINNCIHPYEQVVTEEGGNFLCKFCNKRLTKIVPTLE